MARTPRPVNPDEGPIQAFAYDLRCLRETAGNPTYRVLAKTAGFSATTLGDAAGGVRMPTLEVTLAYVGACGGDAEAWRERWRALDRRLAVERSAADAGAVPEFDAGVATGVGAETESATAIPDPPADDVTGFAGGEPRIAGPRYRRRLQRPVLAATSTLIVVAALVAWRLPVMRNSAAPITPVAARSSTGAARCPSFAQSASPGASTFKGLTYFPITNVRIAAELGAPVRYTAQSGCTLVFTGYCLGAVVADTLGGAPDMRWFMVSGGGVVSSAVVHGNPPPALRPSPCPGSVPGPAAVSLSIAPNSSGAGVVGVEASGSQLWIVGYAAYYSSAAGQVAMWHQVGITASSTTDFAETLRTGVLSNSPGTSGIPVVAVACFGGDGPTTVTSAGTLQTAVTPPQILPLTLTAADLTTAEQTACHYPSPD